MGQNIQNCVDCGKLPIIYEGPDDEFSTGEGLGNFSQSVKVNISLLEISPGGSQSPEDKFLNALMKKRENKSPDATVIKTFQAQKNIMKILNKENLLDPINQSRMDAIKRIKYNKDVSPLLRRPGFVELNLKNVLDTQEIRTEVNSSNLESSNLNSTCQSPSIFKLFNMDSPIKQQKGISSNICQTSLNLVDKIRNKA